MPGHNISVEGRRSGCGYPPGNTLGVKIQESAFRGNGFYGDIESFLFDFYTFYAIIL